MVEANVTNIENHELGAKISNLKLTGNESNQDGIVVISSSRLLGKFSFSVEWDDRELGKYIYYFFNNTRQESVRYIQYRNELSNSYSAECNYNGAHRYQCEGLNISDASYYNLLEESTLATFNVVICDKEQNLTDAKCSRAYLPVQFKN